MEFDASTLAVTTDRLARAGCIAPCEEARELIPAATDQKALEGLLRRRELGEPLAWIVGTTSFCGHLLKVHRGVYVPRPQSEELARRAAALLSANPGGGRAVDLCTGSGAIAVHLMAAAPGAAVVAVDLGVAAANCARSNGVKVAIGDLGRPLRGGRFDVVTAVLPYVPTSELQYLPSDVQRFEPELALDGGDDGLEVARRTVDDAALLLREGGWLLLEIGGQQDRALTPALEDGGFGSVEPWFDDDGDLRGVAAQFCRE